MQPEQLSLGGLCGRTSEEPSTPTEGPTSLQHSKRWPTWGRWSSNGASWTRSSSECPSDGAVSSSSLASILQPPEDVQIRYYLSARAALGVLERAERRKLRAERISYGEIAELQDLVAWIDPSDVELLEWAGVPEHGPDA